MNGSNGELKAYPFVCDEALSMVENCMKRERKLEVHLYSEEEEEGESVILNTIISLPRASVFKSAALPSMFFFFFFFFKKLIICFNI